MRQRTATIVAVAVAVAVTALLVGYGVLRSGGHAGTHEEMMSRQGHHGDAAMAAGGAGGPMQAGEEHAPELTGRVVEGVRVVRVAVRQFEFDPAKIVVREGERVRLELTSEDVNHGIVIEDYGVDRKLLPGKTELVEFTADKPGTHHFHCSVYCGSGHGDMHGELVVLPR